MGEALLACADTVQGDFVGGPSQRPGSVWVQHISGQWQCMPRLHQDARGRQAPPAHPPQVHSGRAEAEHLQASGHEAVERRPGSGGSSTRRAGQPAARRTSPRRSPGYPPHHQAAPARCTRRPPRRAVSRTGQPQPLAAAPAGGCGRQPRAQRRRQRFGLPPCAPPTAGSGFSGLQADYGGGRARLKAPGSRAW